MLNFSVSWLAIIAAAVVAQILGFIWWGAIFGERWAKLMGFSAKEMKAAKEKGMTKPMIVMFIGNIIMAYVLSGLLMTIGATAIGAALTLVFWLWLGFVVTIGVGVVLWQNKPVEIFWINSIGWLVVMGGIAITLLMF